MILPHPLTNFEIQAYYQNEPRFNGVFSRDNLPNTIKNGAYVNNLDEYHDIGTHWVALYVNNKTVTCFDSFGVEHISKEIMKFIYNKNIITSIFMIQAYDSIMFGYFCTGFINFMFNGNTLTGFTNIFSPNDFKENDDKIFYLIFKMVEFNFIEHNPVEISNIYPGLNEISLSDQQYFRLNKINEIKDYFVAEIKQRELMNKRLSKYIAFCDYFDKSLTVLSATSGSISIASFATVIGTTIGVASASLSLTFSLSTRIVKKLLKTTRNKKKKHNKIIMLARSKLNSIKSKVSEALINSEFSHEDFMIIINEEIKYRELKESIGMMNSQRSDSEKINLIEEGKK